MVGVVLVIIILASSFFFDCCWADAAAAATAAAQVKPPPHIIYILADDLGWNDGTFTHGGMRVARRHHSRFRDSVVPCLKEALLGRHWVASTLVPQNYSCL